MRTLILIFTAGMFATGCVSQQVHRVNNTQLTQAAETLPEATLLDVGVVVFDTGIPDDPTVDVPGAFPRLREAEARFMPYQLKNTMQASGYWGAVRVVPAPATSSDLLVFGRIRQSDGDMLDLDIRAEDATGREWLNRRYRQRIVASAYNTSADPYQDVFNQIVNDLVEARRGLDAQELARIRQVAELRFAGDLTPDAFGDYVVQNRQGRYEIRRLPAEDDPMMRRALQIRQREHMFVDTLDGYYGNFFHEVGDDYDRWRKVARDEAEAVRELRSSARWRTGLGIAAVVGAIVYDNRSNNTSMVERVARDVAIYGGIEAIRSGAQKRREAGFHEAAMNEITNAFQGAVRPILVDMQGTTVRLTGSAEAQYEEWQRLMRELYAAETGFIDEMEIYSEALPEVEAEAAPVADVAPVVLEELRMPQDAEAAGSASPDEAAADESRVGSDSNAGANDARAQLRPGGG
ncbi:MAG: hypothetical protein JJU27_09855 [Gammaproteobacteria bacterium]|nr:hypothetical protein [Gammaproteobacteria bacterium]